MKSMHLFVVIAVCTLIGCASDPKQENDPEFGDTVRHMVSQQTFNPAAANNPLDQPPVGLDGTRAAGTFKAYREDVRKPSSGNRPVEIQIGR